MIFRKTYLRNTRFRTGLIAPEVNEMVPKLIRIVASGERPRLDQLITSGQLDFIFTEGVLSRQAIQATLVLSQALARTSLGQVDQPADTDVERLADSVLLVCASVPTQLEPEDVRRWTRQLAGLATQFGANKASQIDAQTFWMHVAIGAGAARLAHYTPHQIDRVYSQVREIIEFGRLTS